MILLLFQTLLRFRLGLLALHLGLFGGLLLAGEPFLCGIHLFALLLRGPLLLVGCFLLLLGGQRDGFGSLFLPLGGVGLGIEFARRPLLFSAKFVGVGLRGTALVEVHFLFLRIGPFPRSGCSLLGGVLFAGRGGAGFGSALLVHAGPVGADLLGIHLGGALLLRLQLLPLGVRLGAGYARGFGCRPRWRDGWINPRWRCGWCRWLALHGDGSPGFAGRMKAPGGCVGFSLLPGLGSHAADDRRDWRRDHHGILRRLLLGAFFVGLGFTDGPRVGGANWLRHGGRGRRRRSGRIAGHRRIGRIGRAARNHRRRSCAVLFSAAVSALRAHHGARLGERRFARPRDGRLRRRRHVGRRPARLRTVALAARPLAGKSRRHRIRVALHRHHFQIRSEHRPGRRGVRREPLRFALKPLPQFGALLPVLHARPAVRHFVRGEGLLHLVLQKLAPHRCRHQRRIHEELVPHGTRVWRKATRAAVEIRPVELRAAHQFQRGDRTLAAAADKGETQPAVVDHRHVAVGVVGDVRDVHRGADDDHVARAIDDHGTQHRRAEIAHAAEAVKRRADVAGRVHPRADADLRLPVGARWQRCPAHVVVALPPRDPRRPPLVVRHPAPARILQIHPPPVMIDDARELLVAHPRPARVGESPVAIRVGRPVAIHVGRTPAKAVIGNLDPFAVRQQRIVEVVERNIRRPGGAWSREREQGGEEEKEEGCEFHGSATFGLNGPGFIQ